MARGRFISNTLGESDKFAELADDTHRLMYVLMLTHTDVEGRLKGNATWLAGRVFTYLPYTHDQIDAALSDLHQVGLIRWYEVSGKRYVQIEKFHDHNKVRRDRESGSEIPAPPEDAKTPPLTTGGGLREGSGSTPSQVEVEVEDQVEVQVQEKERHSSPNGDALASRDDLQTLVDAWNEHRGPLPAAQKLTTKRKSQLRTLIRDLGGIDKAHSAIALGAKEVSHDSFWRKNGYGFDNLLAGQKVIQKAETAWNRGSFDRTQSEKDRMLAVLGAN